MLSAKILVIEDDAELAATVREVLLEDPEAAYTVRIATDGMRGLETVRSWQPDAIILDLNLPSLSGLQLLRCLRQESWQVRVCITSASFSLDERLAGFREGADDYVGKPFSPTELHLRMRALLRRGRMADSTVIRGGDLLLFPDRLQVVQGKRLIRLTRRECSLLRYLMERPDRVVARRELLDAVWEGRDRFPNTVDAYIERLRKKMKQPTGYHYLRTAYGEGYYFDTRSLEGK